MADYIQKGESIDYTTTKALNAGDPVVFGDRIGVAGADIAAKETGALHLTGVWRFNTDETLTAGTTVYLDGSKAKITATKGTLTASGVVVSQPADGKVDVLIG